MKLFSTYSILFASSINSLTPQPPNSMLCRGCGLCSLRNRKINIVQGGECVQDARKSNFTAKCLNTFVAHCSLLELFWEIWALSHFLFCHEIRLILHTYTYIHFIEAPFTRLFSHITYCKNMHIFFASRWIIYLVKFQSHIPGNGLLGAKHKNCAWHPIIHSESKVHLMNFWLLLQFELRIAHQLFSHTIKLSESYSRKQVCQHCYVGCKRLISWIKCEKM